MNGNGAHGSDNAGRGNIQVWYAPGMYQVHVIQFLCLRGEKAAIPDFTLFARPGRAEREWVRKIRKIEDQNMIRHTDLERRNLTRRIYDYPVRKRNRPSARGSVRRAMLKEIKIIRRAKQRLRRLAMARAGSRSQSASASALPTENL